MDLLDLPQLAECSALPVSLTRYYRDRFILFVPSVRIGRSILHPVEAVAVIATIHEHAAAGLSGDAIQAALEQSFPVTIINSQELAGADSGAGSVNVIRALAAAIDERGARLETEIAKLREQTLGSEFANQLQTAAIESQLASISAPGEHAAELQRLRAAVEELRAHVSLLASREQLEWIGDVVAAAALRPPQGALDAAIERRLLDLQEAIQQSRGTGEIAELRSAIDRLTHHVGNRNQEIQRAFQTLVGALRKEIAAVHAQLGELKAAIQMDDISRVDDGEFASAELNDHAVATTLGPNGTVLRHDRNRTRPPRRMGQPLRSGATNGEQEGFHTAH
jgi:hypothetical protein